MSLFLSDDIRALVVKYADTHDACDILKKLTTLCDVELANLTLHKRMDDDVFELFDKDEDAMKVKCRLSGLARVVSYHSASSCSQFIVESEIEFTEDNLTIQDIGCVSSVPSYIEKSGKKRSKSGTMQVDSVRLYYEYNEQGVGSPDRPSGVSVVESPCKTINLTISMARGAAGLDKCVIIDFEMLTAKHSPSENQILLNSGQEGEDDGDSEANASNDDDDTVTSENGASELKEVSVSDNGDNHANGMEEVDFSDYYNVNVNRDALEQLCHWLSFGDSQLESSNKKQRSSNHREADANDDDDNADRYYEQHESSQDMLMLLLSVPFVDDSWAIHTLILDHELGSSDAEEGEDESESGDSRE